jgi:two-component system, NtrC family, sensor kinase
MKILHWLFLFTFLSVFYCFSQDSATTVVHIDKIPTEGILLNKGWKFHPGDNPEYAKPDYDDRAWQSINPTLDIHESLPQLQKSGICWFRLHMSIDSSINHQLALMIYQSGASELYLNGHQIANFGVLSTNPREIKAYDPWGKPVLFPVNNGTNQVWQYGMRYNPGSLTQIFLRMEIPP